jgi:hypothetical protein
MEPNLLKDRAVQDGDDPEFMTILTQYVFSNNFNLVSFFIIFFF